VLSRRIRQAIDQIGACGSVFAPSRSADFTSSLRTTRASTLGKDVHRLDMSDDHPAHADITHIPFATASVQSNRQLYAGLSMGLPRKFTHRPGLPFSLLPPRVIRTVRPSSATNATTRRNERATSNVTEKASAIQSRNMCALVAKALPGTIRSKVMRRSVKKYLRIHLPLNSQVICQHLQYCIL